MTNNNELFTPKEKEILDQKKKNNEITSEEYKKLLKIKKTDIYLDSLKNDTNKTIEQRVNEKIEIIRKKRKGLIEQAKDNIQNKKEELKQKAEEKLKQKKAELEKKLREKADKKLGGFGIGGYIFDTVKDWIKPNGEEKGFFDKIFGKIFKPLGIAILGWLGIKEGVEKLNNMKAKIPEIKEEKQKLVGDDDSKKEKSKNIEKKKPIISAETKQNIKYKTSIKTLLSLSGITIDKTEDTNDIINNIKTKTYTELLKTPNNEIKGNDNIKTVEKIKKQFLSEKFKTIANYNLKGKFVKKMIEKDKDKISKQLSGGDKRVDEILKMIEKNGNQTDWWHNLTIEEIALFYKNSFGLLSIPVVEGVKDTKTTLSHLFFNNQEVENKSNNFISKKILKGFAGIGANFGANTYVDKSKDTILKNKIKEQNLNYEEEQQLNNIIDFKNYLLDNYINDLGNLLKLSDSQKQLFLKNLDYRGVISLYSILGGEHYKTDNVNIINKLSLLYINSKIIGGYEGSEYIGKILYKWFFDSGSIFSDEELKVLGIYKDKLADVLIFHQINEITKKLGFAKGVTNADLGNIAIGLGGGGFLLKTLGKRLIKKGIEKKGISIIGMLFKKLGWIGMVSGALVGGYSFYNKEHLKNTIGEDLEKNKDKPLKIVDILKEYNNSIIEKNIDGKNIKIIKYKNDTPLVIMDGKIFTFDIIDNIDNFKKIIDDFNISDKNSWINIYKWSKNSIIDWVSEKNGKININGKIIDTSKFKINNGFIEIGENNKKYNINELFSGIDNKTTEIHKDLRSYIQEKYPNRKFIWGKGEEFSFIELNKLGDGKTLSLVQIGKINQQKN